jgi:zinc finger protein
MANARLQKAEDLFADMGQKVTDASKDGVGEDETRVVDEIESLCMNCHANVRYPAAPSPTPTQY